MKPIYSSILVLLGILPFVFAQDDMNEFDVVYKFPDLKGQRMKIIRGKVTQETTKGVVYEIGLNQKKRIEPHMVQKVEYAAGDNKHLNKAREFFIKGVAEYEIGNYNDAVTILEQALKRAREFRLDSTWIGAYARFYLGKAFLEEGREKEKKGLLKAIYAKRYKNAVAMFQELTEKFPSHRLQLDTPVPYATALMNLGGAENLDKAVSVLDGVKSLSRNQYVLLRKLKALKLKGDVLQKAGKLDQAETAYEEMLRLAPRGPAIDEIIHLKQFIRIYLGILKYEQASQKGVPDFYDAAEDYFKGILADVSATGIRVKELDKIYFYLGECRFQRKDWERAMWYYLHGSVAYFDDANIHKNCIYKTILCTEKMIEQAKDDKQKNKYVAAMEEWYRQLKNSHGGSKEYIEAGKIYRKYAKN